ncbi:aspartic peptidase domain-containing protein [Schizophyllum commune]
MFSSRLYCLLLLAVTAVASPVVESRADVTASLPLTLQRNVTGGQEMVSAGRQRAQALRAYGHGKGHRPADVPVANRDVIYTATVAVGSAGQTCDSNTWVGAAKPYIPSNTSQNTGKPVGVAYGSGYFVGEEYIDRVTLSKQLVINKQSIGDAEISNGIAPFDGILGRCQSAGILTCSPGSLLLNRTEEIPTVTDNLYSQGTIPRPALGVYFAPAASDSPGGALTFGGADSSLPKTTTSPASAYWGYDQSITYGGKQILAKTAGIADTGTTLIYLPTDAYRAYMASTGAVEDQQTGLLRVTAEQFENMQSLTFTVSGLWPRSRNAEIGGTPDGYYLIVANIGSNSGQGLDFINGYAFLERYYSYYDTKDSKMGFATTKYTNAVVNSQA